MDEWALSPAWVTYPHGSLLVHLPTLSCHNSSPRCSRAPGPKAKVSLELMRAQLCRCQLKIQGATKRAPPPLGGGTRGHASRRFPQVCVRIVPIIGNTFRELHHWAVSMCDHHGNLHTLQCYSLLRSEIRSTHLQTATLHLMATFRRKRESIASGWDKAGWPPVHTALLQHSGSPSGKVSLLGKPLRLYLDVIFFFFHSFFFLT